MPTVPQPYVYPISGIPGGQFGGQQSDRLIHLITSQLPTGLNPVVNSDSIDIIVSFDADLTTEEKTTLDGLVPHCADLYIITIDGGITDLGDPAEITKNAGQQSSSTITLQMKMGDGTNFNSFGEPVVLRAPLMVIDTLGGNFNGSGQFVFTIGAELSRGQADIQIESDSLAVKTVSARWV
jgi:hypothetical protein